MGTGKIQPGGKLPTLGTLDVQAMSINMVYILGTFTYLAVDGSVRVGLYCCCYEYTKR